MEIRFQLGDASSWPADLGIRLSLIGGSLPPAFQIPAYALVTTQGALDFAGGDDPSLPIDFALQAVTVDSSGNESTPSEVHVSDSGKKSSGCSFTGKAPRQAAAFFGVCAGFLFLFQAFQKPRFLVSKLVHLGRETSSGAGIRRGTRH
jgi:hypothetical protein